ncbi:MAG: HEAT repeat domain-containing protein [Chloroflexota bacterium]|nr:HEAT repeat domain-containing protein [Chloroflexota bacterium]
MTTAIQTFLSYKRESQPQVQRLYHHLRAWGFDAWLDVERIPKGIETGSISWMDAIDKGLRGSRVMIACITPQALGSQNVRQEWTWALLAGRRILFLRLEAYDEAQMPHQFSGVNYIDFVADFDRGLTDLKQALTEYTASPDAQMLLKDVGWPSTQAVLARLDELKRRFEAQVPRRGADRDIHREHEGAFSQLRDRVRRYWLEGSLRPGLEEVRLLALPITFEPRAVVQHREWRDDPVRHSLDIRTVFDGLGQFAILGAPGSGKTTILMQLALELLLDESKAWQQRTPFLLNLSSWRPDTSLRNWLLEEGYKTYRIAPKLLARWLDNKQLVLLLDGFDEIPAEHRAAAISAINDFRADKAYASHPLVVATRIAEFRLASDDMQRGFALNGAIALEQIDAVQIERFLEPSEGRDALRGLRALYAENGAVQAMARTPFLLNSMAYVYADRPLTALAPELKTIPERQQHLFDAYLEKRLLPLPKRYKDLAQFKRWLAWLATKIGYYGTVFRPADVDLRWFGMRRALWLIDRPLARLRLLRAQPVRLRVYLRFARERQILREMGGGYTFRHEALRLSLLRLNVGADAQIAALIRDLGDETSYEAAASELVHYGVPAIELLAVELKYADAPMRLVAAWALGQMRAPAVEPLIAAFKDTDENVRMVAAWALGQVGTPAVAPLITALIDVDWNVQERAMETLLKIGTPAVEPLIAVLSDANWTVRCGATKVLGQLGDVRAVEPLIAMLKHGNFHLRYLAAQALGQLGDVRAVEPLIDSLRDSNWGVRLASMKALRHFGALAIEMMVATLDDANWYLRERAVWALGEVGDVQVFKPLIVALRDADTFVRERAVWALGEVGDVQPVEPLIDALKDADKDIRLLAAWALGEIGDVRALEPLIGTLKDAVSEVGMLAASALGQLGSPAVEPLIATLKHADANVRIVAAVALGQIGDRAVKPLIAALKDVDADVREGAAVALGQLGDRAVKPLIAELRNVDEDVSVRAASVLGQIGSPAVEPLITAFKEGDTRMRLVAAWALGQISMPAFNLLISQLKSNDYYVRSMALAVLVSIGTPAVGPLIAALKDVDTFAAHRRTAEALGQIGTSAVEPLIVALKDADKYVRAGAAEALGQIGDVRAVDPLIAALKDDNEAVRSRAATALEQIRDVRGVEPLIAKLRDVNQVVRSRAADALRKIGTPEALQALEDAGWR